MPKTDSVTKPLWKCPRCGHRFVTPNMWHSCTQVDLDAHFTGKEPSIRKLFVAWLAFIRKYGGPVKVIPQKSRISFQARVRFSGAVIHKKWVDCAFWLKRIIQDNRFDKIEKFPPSNFVYHFNLTDTAQLDEQLGSYIREAYQVGLQRTKR